LYFTCCRESRKDRVAANLRAILKSTAVLCALTLFAVNNVGAVDFPPTIDRGYVLSSVIWPHATNGSTNIGVCWENPNAAPANERDWVRRAISRTWEARSMLRFTGWGACVNGFRGIRIVISDSGPYTRGLGTRINGVQNGMLLNFSFRNWSPSCQSTRQFCIEAIAVHEFGHALGFAHEQNRPDTQSSCAIRRQGTSGDTLVGPWDLQSIMNYCNPNWNNDGLLSNIDTYMVRTYYGNVPMYNSQTQNVFFPVVLVNGQKYTGALTQVGSEWEVAYIHPTTQVSSAASRFSGNKLNVPFVAASDGTDIVGFYSATMVLKSNGRYLLTKLTPLN
jgi:hypothetical protein